MFAFKGEVLKGIVHFSDYNQTIVLQAIQDDILTFERNMRQYLFLMGYKNKDMLDYFEYRAKKNDHFVRRLTNLERRSEELDQLGEFQAFDLIDLLDFGNSAKTNRLFPTRHVDLIDGRIQESRLVNDLRNMAMHGKNLVELNQESSVHSVESLDYLFKALDTLKDFTYRIEKRIANHKDYKTSVRMDNQSKLKIIHDHHPKALSYFIGN